MFPLLLINLVFFGGILTVCVPTSAQTCATVLIPMENRNSFNLTNEFTPKYRSHNDCLIIKSNSLSSDVKQWNGLTSLKYKLDQRFCKNAEIAMAYFENGIKRLLQVPPVNDTKRVWNTFKAYITFDLNAGITLNVSKSKSDDDVIPFSCLTQCQFKMQKNRSMDYQRQEEFNSSITNWLLSSTIDEIPTAPITPNDSTSTTTAISTEILPHPPIAKEYQIEWKIISIVFIGITAILIIVTACLWFSMPTPAPMQDISTIEKPVHVHTTNLFPRPTYVNKLL